MSRLLVLTEPALLNGYLLAGAESFAVRNAAEAEVRLESWIQRDLQALAAIDQKIFDQISPLIKKKLNQSLLLVVVIPQVSFELSTQQWQQRIQEMIRQAIGIHITFQEGGKK